MRKRQTSTWGRRRREEKVQGLIKSPNYLASACPPRRVSHNSWAFHLVNVKALWVEMEVKGSGYGRSENSRGERRTSQCWTLLRKKDPAQLSTHLWMETNSRFAMQRLVEPLMRASTKYLGESQKGVCQQEKEQKPERGVSAEEGAGVEWLRKDNVAEESN